jgi:hypothetical protein
VFRIPAEVTEHTLTFLYPPDVAKFSQTCRSAYTLVYSTSDQCLWRRLYLTHFDDARKALHSKYAMLLYDWKWELQRRMRAELIAFNIERRFDEKQFALEAFISVISTAAPVQSASEDKQSKSLKWLIRILRDSKILDTPIVVPERRDCQLTSRIRTCLALSLDRANDNSTATRLAALRRSSRCQVYDIRNYRWDNDYGPYLAVGQINWIHVESLLNIVQMRLMELDDVWMDTRPPVGLEATRAYSVTGASNRAPNDWACIEGTWRRVVCFLDYL